MGGGSVMGAISIAKEWRDEEWFGDVVVTTLGAERITDSHYRVYCQVNNLDKISHSDIMGTRIIMRLEKRSVILGSYLSGNNLVSLSKDVTKDGVYYFEFDNMELGQIYCFQPHLYRTWTEFHSAVENMAVSDIFINGGNIGSISVADCKSDVFMYGEIGTFATNSSSIESIEISKCEAKRGKINFVLTVKGTAFAAPNNDEETIGQGSIGVYTLKDGEYEYYPANEINGNNFSSELSFEGSIYTMDNIDYSNFIASKPIKIGSYIMAYKQNGQYDYDKIYYYSDTQNYELYYNERPTINFNSVEITGTYTGQEINGKIYDYVTHFRFNYSIKGCFWMNSLQYTIQQSNWNNHWSTDYEFSDGTFNASGISYYSNSDGSHTSYYDIELLDGSHIQSTNYLIFLGDGTCINNAYISNSSSTKAKVRKNIMAIHGIQSSCGSESD